MNWTCEKCKEILPKIELNEIFGWGLYLCTDCIEKFLQPERSKREDYEEPCNYCGTPNSEFPNRKCSRTSICTNS
jgi:hypothetical protein